MSHSLIYKLTPQKSIKYSSNDPKTQDFHLESFNLMEDM